MEPCRSPLPPALADLSALSEFFNSRKLAERDVPAEGDREYEDDVPVSLSVSITRITTGVIDRNALESSWVGVVVGTE